MTIHRKYLDLIAAGAKTVEVRVAYPSNRTLIAGQALRLVSGDASCLTTITTIRQYDSFESMLDHEDAQAISGEPGTREALLAACRAIYPPEKERLGVLALHINVPD